MPCHCDCAESDPSDAHAIPGGGGGGGGGGTTCWKADGCAKPIGANAFNIPADLMLTFGTLLLVAVCAACYPRVSHRLRVMISSGAEL